MKKCTSFFAFLLLSVFTFLSFFSISPYVNAEYEPNRKYIYISNKTETSFLNCEKKTTSDCFTLYPDSENVVRIIDYLEFVNDKELGKIVEQSLLRGGYLYIRAKEALTNSAVLSSLLPGDDTGEIGFEDYKEEQKGTIGYLAFIDVFGGLQCVQLKRSAINEQTINNRETLSKANLSLDIKGIRETTPEQELAFVDKTLSSFSMFLSKVNLQKGTSSNPEGFNSGKAHYIKIVDTEEITLSDGITIIGRTTRRIFAYRLHPEATNNTGTPIPSAGTGETRWAWKAVYSMDPEYSNNGYFNLYSRLKFVTHPAVSTYTTYKQVIAEYAPTQNLSGNSSMNIELSESPSLSFTANFDHVNITNESFITGPNLNKNVVSIKYDISCLLYPFLWSQAKNVIDLPIAAVTINTGSNKACIQLRTQPAFGKSATPLTYHTYLGQESKVSWKLPVR